MQTQAHPAAPTHAVRPNRAIACQVSITTADGGQHAYYALMPSTCAAVIHALDWYGPCKVHVRALRRQQP